MSKMSIFPASPSSSFCICSI